MKIIVRAKDILPGSVVTKPTGDKKYTLYHELKIYGLELDNLTAPGHVLLVHENHVNIHDENKELAWEINLETLVAYYGRKLCDQCNCSYS